MTQKTMMQALSAGSYLSPEQRLLFLLTKDDSQEKLIIKRNENQLPFDAGCHVILGLPRSGKTTLARSICSSTAGEYFTIDEPMVDTTNDVIYGPSGIAQLFKLIYSESSPVFVLDSLRTLIHSLGGPTQKGGISATYKELLTIINNIGVKQNKVFILIVTSDADVLLDLRASVRSVTVIENMTYLTQKRESIYASSDDQIFRSFAVSPLTSFNGAPFTMYSYELTRRFLGGDENAMDYLRLGLPYSAYERKLIGAIPFDISPRSFRSNEKVDWKSDTETINILSDINFE